MADVECTRNCQWTLRDAAAAACLDCAVTLGFWWLIGLFASKPYSLPIYLLMLAVRLSTAAGVTVMLVRRSQAQPEQLGIRLHHPAAGWKEALSSYAVLAALYAVLGAVALVVVRRFNLIGELDVRRYAAGIGYHPGGMAGMFLSLCVVAPVAEELIYRGILYPPMRAALSPRRAVLVNGLVFGAIHVLWSGHLFFPIAQTLGGFAMAWTFERTRNLAFPVILHAFGNCLVFASYLVASTHLDLVLKLLNAA